MMQKNTHMQKMDNLVIVSSVFHILPTESTSKITKNAYYFI